MRSVSLSGPSLDRAERISSGVVTAVGRRAAGIRGTSLDDRQEIDMFTHTAGSQALTRDDAAAYRIELQKMRAAVAELNSLMTAFSRVLEGSDAV